MNLVFDAMMFARQAHADQVRKYTENPYTDHLAEVAGIVASIALDSVHLRGVMLATAWLHDSIEDQGVAWEDLCRRFGQPVAEGVQWLSDMETEGNRATRKAASRVRLAAAPPWVQTVKCADLISNTSSIVKHDPAFAATYLMEKRLLLEVMVGADRRLWNLAMGQAKAISA